MASKQQSKKIKQSYNDFLQITYIIENVIGYTFNNKELLRQAFVHSSAKSYFKMDNEELEYIGDRVMYYALLHLRLPNITKEDGTLYSGRQVIIKFNRDIMDLATNKTWSKYIKTKGLMNYIIKGTTYNPNNLKTSADLFEAIMGAVAVDSDWDLKQIENVYHTLTDGVVRGKGLLARIESTK